MFIKETSKIANPVYKLPENEITLFVDDACLKSFHWLKEKLTSSPIFVSLDWPQPFGVMCDTSGVARGDVLL